MTFRDVKQNYTVFIFDTDKLEVGTGKVISNGFSRYEPSINQTVVDFKVEYKGNIAEFSFPENQSLAKASKANVYVAADRDTLVNEIKAMHDSAEQDLKAVNRKKEIVEKTKVLLKEFNPEYKAQAENEERFAKLEGQFSDMKGSVSRMEKMMSELFEKLK